MLTLSLTLSLNKYFLDSRACKASPLIRLEPILQFLAPWTVEAASLIRNCAGVVLGSEHTLHLHVYGVFVVRVATSA